MKHLNFTLLLFTLASSLAAQTAKVDTVVTEIWNGSAWVNDTKIIYTYDASCLASSTLVQDWDETSSTWVNALLTSYTYNSNNLVSEELSQTWDVATSSWDDAERKTNTYDGSNKLLSYTIEINFLGTWTLFLQTTYSYDASNYIDSILTQSAFPPPLQNSTLAVYTNNSDGTPSQIVIQTWNLVTSAWDNSLRNTFTYNASAQQLTQLIQQWQTNAWVNFDSTTFTYNGSGMLISSLTQRWNGSSWDDDSRSTYTYATSCTLPLKLISFTASENENIIQLNWQTAEEINTSHFNIQRSVDGIHFSSIGNINAKGGSSQTNSYSYTDIADKIIGDKAYYRLQMFDKDGKFTYSKIVPVTLELFAGKIKVYPNPVKDQLYILFNMQNATKAELRITDAAGKTIHTQRLTTAQSNNAASVNVSSLKQGVYYLQIITDNGVQKTRFIKQ